MAARPLAESFPYDNSALSANNAAMSVHRPNCEYCAYVSCTRLTERTDSARSTFTASRWTRAAGLRLGLWPPAAATTCRTPIATSSASPRKPRERNDNAVIIESLVVNFGTIPAGYAPVHHKP